MTRKRAFRPGRVLVVALALMVLGPPAAARTTETRSTDMGTWSVLDVANTVIRENQRTPLRTAGVRSTISVQVVIDGSPPEQAIRTIVACTGSRPATLVFHPDEFTETAGELSHTELYRRAMPGSDCMLTQRSPVRMLLGVDAFVSGWPLPAPELSSGRHRVGLPDLAAGGAHVRFVTTYDVVTGAL